MEIAVLVGAKAVIGYTAVTLGVFDKPAKVRAQRGVTASYAKKGQVRFCAWPGGPRPPPPPPFAPSVYWLRRLRHVCKTCAASLTRCAAQRVVAPRRHHVALDVAPNLEKLATTLI